MAHKVSRATRGPRPRYKWCGTLDSGPVTLFSSQAAADGIILCESLVDLDVTGMVTVERIILQWTIERTSDTADLELGYVVAVQPVTAAGVPLEKRDALTADMARTGSRDIVLAGLLPLSAGPVATVPALAFHQVEFRARRRLARLNHALVLWLTAKGATNIANVVTHSRVLLRT